MQPYFIDTYANVQRQATAKIGDYPSCVMHRNRTSQLHGRTRLNQTASKRNLHKKAAQNAPLSDVSVFLSFYLADVLKISIVR